MWLRLCSAACDRHWFEHGLEGRALHPEGGSQHDVPVEDECFPSAWRQLSLAVVERDGAYVRCGGSFMLGAHHVIPRAEGSPDVPAKLETLCVRCHGPASVEERR
jgi:hypothetical protein